MTTFVLEPGVSASEVLKGLEERFTLQPQEPCSGTLSYLDTFDWRLWDAELVLSAVPRSHGFSLALGEAHEQGSAGSLELRVSHSPAFVADLPPGAFRDRVGPLVGIRRLLPVVRVRWKGEILALRNEDGKIVIRILSRWGQASPPESRKGRPVPPRLEILPLKGYGSECRRAVALLRRHPALSVLEGGELPAVLEVLGRAPGDYSSSYRLPLDSGLRTGEAARMIHLHLLHTLLVNRPGVIRDLDPEFLHDFRVAVRRARSALALIKGAFPAAVTARFARELKWLGERTGPTRDMDVYLLKIPTYRMALSETATDQLEPLVKLLEKKKRIAHGRMVRSLTSKRFDRFVEEWREFLETPLSEGSEVETWGETLPVSLLPIQEVASLQIAKAYGKVLRRGRKTDRKTSPETLHRLRIDCKKLRYLMTLFKSLYPHSRVAPLVKEVKALQDTLGDFNDLYVQRGALLSFAGEMMAEGKAPPSTLMAMGQLMGGLEARQAAELERFHQSFKRFAREKNQRRFQALFAPGSTRGISPPAEEGIPSLTDGETP